MFAMCYGNDKVPLLSNLVDAGIIRIRDKAFDWEKQVKNFEMITDELNLVTPKDYSYVFGGLSPLSIKYIEAMVDLYAPNLE